MTRKEEWIERRKRQQAKSLWNIRNPAIRIGSAWLLAIGTVPLLCLLSIPRGITGAFEAVRDDVWAKIEWGNMWELMTTWRRQ